MLEENEIERINRIRDAINLISLRANLPKTKKWKIMYYYLIILQSEGKKKSNIRRMLKIKESYMNKLLHQLKKKRLISSSNGVILLTEKGRMIINEINKWKRKLNYGDEEFSKFFFDYYNIVNTLLPEKDAKFILRWILNYSRQALYFRRKNEDD